MDNIVNTLTNTPLLNKTLIKIKIYVLHKTCYKYSKYFTNINIRYILLPRFKFEIKKSNMNYYVGNKQYVIYF